MSSFAFLHDDNFFAAQADETTAQEENQSASVHEVDISFAPSAGDAPAPSGDDAATSQTPAVVHAVTPGDSNDEASPEEAKSTPALAPIAHMTGGEPGHVQGVPAMSPQHHFESPSSSAASPVATPSAAESTAPRAAPPGTARSFANDVEHQHEYAAPQIPQTPYGGNGTVAMMPPSVSPAAAAFSPYSDQPGHRAASVYPGLHDQVPAQPYQQRQQAPVQHAPPPAAAPVATRPPTQAYGGQMPPPANVQPYAHQHQPQPQQAYPQQQQYPPQSRQSAPPSIPVGLPVERGMGELICPFCTVRLRYPIGSELIRCGSCQSISRIPPATYMQQQQQQQQQQQLQQRSPSLSYQQPPPQQQRQPVPPQATSTRVQFQCSGCTIWLAADLSVNNGVSRCPQCQTLLRPLINMPQKSQTPATTARQQAPATQVRPQAQPQVQPQTWTPQQRLQQQQVRDYHTANNIPIPAGMTAEQSAAWLQRRHDQIVQQQEQLLAEAKASKSRSNSVVAPPPPVEAPRVVEVPRAADAPRAGQLPAQQVLTAESAYLGQPQTTRRTSVGDYSSVSYLQHSAPAQPQPVPYVPAVVPPPAQAPPRRTHADYVSVPDGLAPPASSRPFESARAPLSDADDADFHAQMAARLDALRVDEEGGQQPLHRPPPKPKSDKKDARSQPLLANMM